MKDRSTMGPIEYISESVFWGLISMIWYKNILFRCLLNLTYETSRAVLWSMLLASIVVCSGYFFRKKIVIRQDLVQVKMRNFSPF